MCKKRSADTPFSKIGHWCILESTHTHHTFFYSVAHHKTAINYTTVDAVLHYITYSEVVAGGCPDYWHGVYLKDKQVDTTYRHAADPHR